MENYTLNTESKDIVGGINEGYPDSIELGYMDLFPQYENTASRAIIGKQVTSELMQKLDDSFSSIDSAKNAKIVSNTGYLPCLGLRPTPNWVFVTMWSSYNVRLLKEDDTHYYTISNLLRASSNTIIHSWVLRSLGETPEPTVEGPYYDFYWYIHDLYTNDLKYGNIALDEDNITGTFFIRMEPTGYILELGVLGNFIRYLIKSDGTVTEYNN